MTSITARNPTTRSTVRLPGPSRGSRALAITLTLGLSALLAGCGKDDPIDAARGDWVFVNYWATWCKPCRKEIPELNALHAAPGFTVLGVNYDGSTGAALEEEVSDLGIDFPTLGEDPALRYGVERPQVLPTTLVLSPAGELREVLVGPQTEETLRALAAGTGD